MIKFEKWKETADLDELWKEFVEEMSEIGEYEGLTEDDFDDFLLNKYESELDSYYDEKYEMSKEEL